MDIIEQVAIGLVPIIIGFMAGRAWGKAKLLVRYGYIRKLIAGKDRVQVVVSSVEISRFKSAENAGITSRVQVPPNVLYMPMPEGRAVSELTSLLHKVNPRVKVKLITPAYYDPGIPTLCIGGPSVNSLSGRLLSSQFPEFKIEYPATRRARYGGHFFETSRDEGNMLTRDFGFIFLTRTARGEPCMIFCGIRAFGTAMAVELLGKLPTRSEAARLISHGRKAFIVGEGKVDGLEETSARLMLCQEVHDELTVT